LMELGCIQFSATVSNVKMVMWGQMFH
jgi:hypothetical protein